MQQESELTMVDPIERAYECDVTETLTTHDLSAGDAYAAGLHDALSACRRALHRPFSSPERADRFIQAELRKLWLDRIDRGELPNPACMEQPEL
jgi:hypothetical protein